MEEALIGFLDIASYGFLLVLFAIAFYIMQKAIGVDFVELFKVLSREFRAILKTEVNSMSANMAGMIVAAIIIIMIWLFDGVVPSLSSVKDSDHNYPLYRMGFGLVLLFVFLIAFFLCLAMNNNDK